MRKALIQERLEKLLRAPVTHTMTIACKLWKYMWTLFDQQLLDIVLVLVTPFVTKYRFACHRCLDVHTFSLVISLSSL